MPDDDLELEPAALDVPADDEPPADDVPADDEPPADDVPADDEPPADDVPVHKMSRSEARIQKLANERAEAQAQLKAAQEQAEFYRRQAEQAARGQQSQQDQVYVDPEEQWRRDMQNTMNHALFTANDTKDQAAYMLQAAKNPLYAKYEARVEAMLAKERSQGRNATREGILKFLIGEDAVANVGKKTPAARQASARVDAARGQAPAVRSTAPAPKSESSLEERLKGIPL